MNTIKSAIESHKDYIMNEVLADSIAENAELANDPDATKTEINGEVLYLKIKKAE